MAGCSRPSDLSNRDTGQIMFASVSGEFVVLRHAQRTVRCLRADRDRGDAAFGQLWQQLGLVGAVPSLLCRWRCWGWWGRFVLWLQPGDVAGSEHCRTGQEEWVTGRSIGRPSRKVSTFSL